MTGISQAVHGTTEACRITVDIGGLQQLAEEHIRNEKLLSDSIINSLSGIFYLFDVPCEICSVRVPHSDASVNDRRELF